MRHWHRNFRQSVRVGHRSHIRVATIIVSLRPATRTHADHGCGRTGVGDRLRMRSLRVQISTVFRNAMASCLLAPSGRPDQEVERQVPCRAKVFTTDAWNSRRL